MNAEPEPYDLFARASDLLSAADQKRLANDHDGAQALYRQAVEGFDLALAGVPAPAMVHLARGYALGMLGQEEAAESELARTAELDPGLTFATHQFRGYLRALDGRQAEALEEYASALAAATGDAARSRNLGDLRLSLQDPQGAVEAYGQAIGANPTSPELYLARALSSTMLGRTEEVTADVDESLRRLESASNLDAIERAKLYARAGEIRLNSGDASGAHEAYSRAIELDRTSVDAYVGRAALLAQRGEWQQAVDDYSKALELDPGREDAHRFRGIYLEALGRYEEALADYVSVIELGGATAEDYRNQADAERALERNEEAIANYTRALELDPDLLVVYDARARLKASEGDLAGAVDDLTEVVRRGIASQESYRLRGIYLEALARYEEALADYRQVIELGEATAEDYRNRADAQVSLGSYEEARADYSMALERDPALVPALLGRADVLRRLGELEPALRDCESALSLDPQNAEAYRARAGVLAALGEHERAASDYERSLHFEPDNVSAHRSLVLAQFEVGDDQFARGLRPLGRRTYEAALTSTRRGLLAAPDDPWLHGYEAVCHRLLNAYDRGIDAATTALEQPGADDPVAGAWLLRERADSLRQWGEGDNLPERFEESLVDLRNAAQVAGDDAEAIIFEYQGHSLVALERYAESIPLFGEATRRDPRAAWPYIGSGKARYCLGDVSAALAAFDVVLGLDAPDVDLAHVGRGLCLERQGSSGEAEAAFNAALAGREGAAGFHQRSSRFVYFGLFERTEADLRRAIELDPDHKDALNELAWLFVHDWPRPDRLDEAFELAQRAIELEGEGPSLSNYLDTGGWIAFTLGRTDEARQMLDRAVELDPHDVLIRMHVAAAGGKAGSLVEPVARARHSA